MARKIYDIIPPEHQAERHEEMARDCSAKEPIKRKRRKFPFVPLLVLIVLSLVGVFFFVQGKAEVTISPRTEDVTAEASLVVDTNEAVIDYENSVVPGIVFIDKRDGSQNFDSTGTDDKAKKATGTIKVFNKMKPAKALSLVKGTRFLSVPGEMIYKSDAAFTIPAATSDSVPGSVEIKVTAAEAGAKYNIASATFSVPGLNGSEYYSNIWAESVTAFSGGEESTVKIATKNDISLSKDKFEEKYDEESKQALITSIPSGYYYFQEDISPVISGLTVSVKEGAEVDQFNVLGHVESEVTVFRNEDVNKLGEKLLMKDVSELKTIVPGSVAFEVKEKKLNKDGTLSLKVAFTGKIYSLPEDSILMDSLLGKDTKYSASLLENIPEIESVTINLSPWWKWKIPSSEERVDVKLNFNGN
ncbi:MAG: baseplate J/gp47 family protein [Candidatus Paceibacterota bacterium]